MSLESVREYLRNWDKDTDILEPMVSTATVEEAAKAINTEPARIAKSISLYNTEKEDAAIIIVAAGDAKLWNSKFKSELGMRKANMLKHEDVLRLTGHEVGGVCPFANPDSLQVYLDVSLKRFETVFPACGTSNSLIKLTLDELERFSQSKGWINVCKDWGDSGEQ